MNNLRIVILVLAAGAILGAALAPPAGAQELRTVVAGVATLQAENAEGVRLSMSYDGAVAVLIARESPFLQGFEIELKLPPALASAPGAFAYELWRRIDPAPDKARYGYSGDRIISRPLPARAGFAIQVPVRRDHSIKESPYATLLPIVVEPKDFPFMLKLLPIAKGVSPEVESAQVQVRVRPLLTDEGALRLSLKYPEGAAERGPVVVAVDERRVDPAALLTLKAGQHHLHVAAEDYRDEDRGFAIEQGRVLELVVELKDTTPILAIEAPDSAVVTLDGVRIDHGAKPQMAVEPGEHSVVCKLGDYSLSRRFVAARGRTYRIVLSVDLEVREDQ